MIVNEEKLVVKGIAGDFIKRQVMRVIASKFEAIKRGDFDAVEDVLKVIAEQFSKFTGVNVSVNTMIGVIKAGLEISQGDWRGAIEHVATIVTSLSEAFDEPLTKMALASLGELLAELSKKITKKNAPAPSLFATGINGDVNTEAEFAAATESISGFAAACAAEFARESVSAETLSVASQDATTEFGVMEAIALISFGVKAFDWWKKRREENRKKTV